MDVIVHNREQLKAEITRLEARKTDLELSLKQHLNSPANVLASVVQMVRGSNQDTRKFSELFKSQDLYGVVARFVMPLVLNKTLFRSSNFIVKAIVAMVSQKASGAINKNVIHRVSDTVSGFFDKFTRKKKKKPVALIGKSPAEVVPPPVTY